MSSEIIERGFVVFILGINIYINIDNMKLFDIEFNDT